MPKIKALDDGEDYLLDSVLRVLEGVIVESNSFPKHRGRPGQQGGSLPRSGSGSAGAGAESGKGSVADRVKKFVTSGLLNELQDGGFSISVDGVSPKTGYMTATSSETEMKIPVGDVDLDTITEYAIDNFAQILEKDAYLWGWLDKDKKTGEVYAYLDVSTNVQGLKDTIELGSKSKQIGIFDLKNKRTIYIDYERNKAPFYYKDEAETIKVYI